MSVTILTKPAEPIEQPRADLTPQRDAGKAKVERGPVRRVLHYLAVGLSVLLLAVVGLLAVLVIGLPAVARATPYTILTGSMQPTLPPGTLVVVRATPIKDIAVGDVITYQVKSGQPTVVTHRVISIQQPTKPGGSIEFITKGDANNLADPPVRTVQVRGVVWYSVPYIGWVNNVVNGDARAIIVPLAAGALFLYAGWMVVSDRLDRRRKRRAALETTEDAADGAAVESPAAEAVASVAEPAPAAGTPRA